MKNKSIIGFGYKPNNAKAVCLKTNSITRLGGVEYKIIADPYEREFAELEPVPLSLFGEKKKVLHTAMAVNVLDSVTGLTYAVEYVPANLVRLTSEPQTDQSVESVYFATRAKQIAEELNALFTGEGIADKCAVAFFTVSDCGDNKGSKGISFIGGNMRQIKQSIIKACSKSPEAFEIVRGAAIEASLRDILDNKK